MDAIPAAEPADEPMSVAELAHLAMTSPDASAYPEALDLTRSLMTPLTDDPRLYDRQSGMFTAAGVAAMRRRFGQAGIKR